MGMADDLKEKTEGMVDEAKGDWNQHSVNPVKGIKGGIQKVKGKIKQKDADEKMKEREETNTEYDEYE